MAVYTKTKPKPKLHMSRRDRGKTRMQEGREEHPPKDRSENTKDADKAQQVKLKGEQRTTRQWSSARQKHQVERTSIVPQGAAKTSTGMAEA